MPFPLAEWSFSGYGKAELEDRFTGPKSCPLRSSLLAGFREALTPTKT